MPSPKGSSRRAPSPVAFREAITSLPASPNSFLKRLRSGIGRAGSFLHNRFLGTRQANGKGRRFLGRVFNKARSLTRRGMSAARGARYGFKRGSTMRKKFSRALFGARHGYRGAVVASPIAKALSAARGRLAASPKSRIRAALRRGALRGVAPLPAAAAAPAPAVVEAVEDFTARPSARAQANVLTAIASSPPRAAASALSVAANGPVGSGTGLRLLRAPTGGPRGYNTPRSF
jgi:hypothetical protein